MLQRTERWFVRQGIPHFIEDYRSRTHILPRMIPVILLLVIATVNPVGFFVQDLAVAGVLAGVQLLVIYGFWAWGYARPEGPWRIFPRRVGWVATVSAFVGVPVAAIVVAYLIDGKPPSPIVGDPLVDLILYIIVTVLMMSAVLLIAYVITSYAMVPLTRRALVQVVRELAGSLPLHARAMPILLLANVFLFFTNELWQVVHVLPGWKVGLLAGVFALLSALVIATGVREELSRIQQALSAGRVVAECDGTPLTGYAPRLAAEAGVTPLRRRQELNMLMVLGARQLIQAAVVALGIFAFFVVLGLIVLDGTVVANWIGDGLGVPPGSEVAGPLGVRMSGWVLTMAKFAGALAAFSAFSFVVTTVSDASYRTIFFAPAVRELERWLAVRAAYQVLHRRTR